MALRVALRAVAAAMYRCHSRDEDIFLTCLCFACALLVGGLFGWWMVLDCQIQDENGIRSERLYSYEHWLKNTISEQGNNDIVENLIRTLWTRSTKKDKDTFEA